MESCAQDGKGHQMKRNTIRRSSGIRSASARLAASIGVLTVAVVPAFAQNSSGNNQSGQTSPPPARPGAIPMNPRPGAIPMPRVSLGSVPAPTNNNGNGGQVIIRPPIVCPPPVYYYPQGGYAFPPTMGPVYVERYPSVPGSVHYNERQTYVTGYVPYVPAPVYTTPGYGVQQTYLGPTVDLGNGTRITLFNSYRTTFVNGQTVVSPFGLFYGCQPYIASSVIINAPYPYASGVNIGAVQPWTDTDRFVAADRNRGQKLRAALNDLTRSWENGDLAAFRRHLDPEMSVAVFQSERFLYSLRPSDLYALTSDTIDGTETISFRFGEVQERNDGLVNAYATHIYRVRGENETRSAKVRCTFVYLEGQWYLSALSLAPGTLR
jgi:hypothetical protein